MTKAEITIFKYSNRIDLECEGISYRFLGAGKWKWRAKGVTDWFALHNANVPEHILRAVCGEATI
jgi:hypothetical protein